ncbi:MAG: pyruvate:ferredoxin (flavodoxin) oxidoreductase [Verrucomicrobia bacterium]|nr:pyruvate:ferredoxin (flavodoxin) oxidoreductase [Verrucomicrobiota bacterium]
MKPASSIILDANEVTASVAYRLSETIAIYPITPSSPMAESCDEWSAQSKPNLFGAVPVVTEMQSEGGAAGAVHGMLQAGSLTTTFTASQGLLLMIPNMYKIAGELMPFCMHVTARTLATHALSIFGDHSDVMAVRQTGFAMLCSNSVQEAQDMAAIAHIATLRSRVPFLHFFDGFRTSHEINTITPLKDEELRQLYPSDALAAFRNRALTPDAPTVRGTAQNPDVFFQAREAANLYHDRTPAIVREVMADFTKVTGREYDLIEYVGHREAEHVIVAMGSACETIEETVFYLNNQGARLGVLKVRLFRPLCLQSLLTALPQTVKTLAVLDRTKEPGALGEPLYQDVVTALQEGRESGLMPADFCPRIIGGRYGLGSKEFTPAMVCAIFAEMSKSQPKRRFTVGIVDDVTGLSLDVDYAFDLEDSNVFRSIFFGLGSDGTVGANKNTIKIIGDETENYAQAYFVYDSKKSGAMTTSHLRFGKNPIRAPYLIGKAHFIGCHQFNLLEKYDVLENAADKAVFLLNTTYPADRVWQAMPREVQEQIITKKLRFYVIDAYHVARDSGMGGRINTIMQTCFFAISGVLPRDEAIAKIKRAIEKTYGRKGLEVVAKNFQAVDATLAQLHEVAIPGQATSDFNREELNLEGASDFVRKVTAVILRNKGDLLPVSAFPVDGIWPTATTKYEKRNIAQEIPVWSPDICIQCNKCAFVCPHAAIRAKFYPEQSLLNPPDSFRSITFKSRENPGNLFTIQVAPEDCTGCGICVEVCPGIDKKAPDRRAILMEPQLPIRDRERENFRYFLDLPEPSTENLKFTVKDTQFKQPLFEFSGACAGCGETPYIKLLSQLYGDHMMIANATGCSSIFGGNLPTTPYAVNAEGRGPAWANSLFEDNAEFGMGMRVALDHKRGVAQALLNKLAPSLPADLVDGILSENAKDTQALRRQRERVRILRSYLVDLPVWEARELNALADYLVHKAVWIVGGDGWAYDIGFGGLDHVLASGTNINVLVLDTGTYSNTGGQSSKATPMGAVAKFAAAGKALPKKDLGLQAMMYGHVYVAQVAMGAKDTQTVQALTEASSYDGPSVVIAYSHCISHGIDMCSGLDHQQNAVNSGLWPLYRFDPRRVHAGEPALKLDSKPPSLSMSEFMAAESRFGMLRIKDPKRAQELAAEAQKQAEAHYRMLQLMADKAAGKTTATE